MECLLCYMTQHCPLIKQSDVSPLIKQSDMSHLSVDKLPKCRGGKNLLSCESIHAVRMPRGSGSGDDKNHKHRKYECPIPFMWCGSGTACSSVPCFFSRHHGVIRAAATWILQQKVGVVCTPTDFCFVSFCYVGFASGLILWVFLK